VGFAEACRCDAPAPGNNGTVNGVQVSVCSSDCRVHSRGASSQILSNFQGPASNTIPLLRASTPPDLNHHRIRSLCTSWTAVIRYSSFSTLQILFRVLSAHKSSILLSAPLLTCERIDVAQHQPPTLHLGADALERSRNHFIHDEHNPFQVDAKQLDIELALIVNPIHKIILHSCRDAAQPSPSVISLAGRAPTC
jgi:hypothetical protein